eukprot:TRINITY_DN28329_c0_g1_i1.p1 TRINITY_DN28329_c0_g1~~TRINITY_DN28329_c0_g1_i1.p1  ORF type:complete len:818 (+),score=181.41 TRINITY_DN28329_c0_g1_i1:308-2761(+)
MEFAQLIAPTGPWNRAWLAAHWDKKLRRQDYTEMNVSGLVSSFLERRHVVSLRSTGHLLLGLAKVYAKKAQLLDDDAVEVKTRLTLAFSNDAATRRRGGIADATSELAASEFLREVDTDLAPGLTEQAIKAGKKHVARLEDITLKMPLDHAASGASWHQAMTEEFGAMTEADLVAALKDLQESRIIPVEPVLKAEAVGFDETLPLVAYCAPEEKKEEEQVAPLARVADAPSEGAAQAADAAAEAEASNRRRNVKRQHADISGNVKVALPPTPIADGPSDWGVAMPLAPPMQAADDADDALGDMLAPLDMDLDLDYQDQASHPQPTTSMARGTNPTDEVEDKLEPKRMSLKKPTASPPQALVPMENHEPAVASHAEDPLEQAHDFNDVGDDPVDRAELIVERSEDQAAMVPEGAGDVHPALVPVEPSKRRRRTFFILDEATEIPKETYQGYINDRSGITRRNPVDYTITLPHYSPNIPNFTTTFTDLCPSLVQCLLMGSEVAEKRRRLMQQAEGAGRFGLFASGPIGYPGEGGAMAPAYTSHVSDGIQLHSSAPGAAAQDLAAMMSDHQELSFPGVGELFGDDDYHDLSHHAGHFVSHAGSAFTSHAGHPSEDFREPFNAHAHPSPAAAAMSAMGLNPLMQSPLAKSEAGLVSPQVGEYTGMAAAVPAVAITKVHAVEDGVAVVGVNDAAAQAMAAAAEASASALADGHLLQNAPTSLDAIITGNMDNEDQSGQADVRVGYSARTEKMHRFLARRFVDSRENTLSFEGMCKQQAKGRRELIAGGFFELLVLKTNGVIGLKQDEPQSDIKISKSTLWAR